MTTTRDAEIASIAKTILRLETLETRKSDGLDFSDQAVWTLRSALEAAYEAGRRSVGGADEDVETDVETNVTAAQAFSMMSRAEMKPFTPADWNAFSGCESKDPMIGECDGHTIVLDGTSLLVVANGDIGGGQSFELGARR